MKKFIIAALLALVAAAPAGAGNRNPPQTPEAARAAFNAPAGPPVILNEARVTSAQALAASKRPGFVSQGNPGAGDPCWSITWSLSWGIWPYGRTTHLFTYWCAVSGQYITYRSSNTYHDTSGLCSGSGDTNYRYSGGVGYTYVDVMSYTYFSCPTPWWWSLNDRLWELVHYNTWGQSWIISDGDAT